MMRRRYLLSEAGFTLTELLIVVAIMGLVITAVMGLFVNMQKNTGGAEEVVELQSGLRVGVDWIARDLRMASFLCVGNAFTNAQSTTFTVRTATAYNAFARVGNAVNLTAQGVGDNFSLTINPPEMVQTLRTGDFVRIVRPMTANQPTELAQVTPGVDVAQGVFRVVSNPIVNPLVIEPATVGIPATSLQVGDMLVRVQPPASLTFPHTITYSLEDDTDSDDPAMMRLVRTSNVGVDRITGKITSLNFSYILDDYSVVTAVAPADLGKVVAVSVELAGATDVTKTGQAAYAGIKRRELGTIVKLRNH